MLIELHNQRLNAEKQIPIKVFYNGSIVGEFFADILVEKIIILELKAAEYLLEEHELQLLNYLKTANIEVGQLLNFGKKPEFKSKIFTNDRKRIENR